MEEPYHEMGDPKRLCPNCRHDHNGLTTCWNNLCSCKNLYSEQQLFSLEEILWRHMGHTLIVTMPLNKDRGFALYCNYVKEEYMIKVWCEMNGKVIVKEKRQP